MILEFILHIFYVYEILVVYIRYVYLSVNECFAF